MKHFVVFLGVSVFICATRLYAGSDVLSGMKMERITQVAVQGPQFAPRTLVPQQDAVIQAYKRELRARYHLDPRRVDFTLQAERRVGRQSCREYVQTLDGMEILGTAVSICFGPTGELLEKRATLTDGAMLSATFPIRKIQPFQAEEKAIAKMRMELGMRLGSPQRDRSKVTQVWVENLRGPGLVQAYRVDLHTDKRDVDPHFPEGKYSAFVDSANGELLVYEDHIQHNQAHHDALHGLDEVTGAGFVYPVDPINTPELEVRELRGMAEVGRLNSKFVKVLNEDTEEVYRETGVFEFLPGHTHFDEVQIYYAAQVALHYGYLPWGFEPARTLPVVVHYGTNYANAFYDRSKIAMGDGDGTFLKNTSHDNSVFTHEYGHFVVDETSSVKVRPWFGDDAAIHEGLADYAACALYEKPTLGEGVMVNEKPLRRCDTKLPFETKDQGAHVGGQVLSGAMWEARMAFDADPVWDALEMDQIFIHALPRIQSTGTLGSTRMDDVYRAILAADESLFQGVHKEVLQEIFESRGFSLDGKRSKGIASLMTDPSLL